MSAAGALLFFFFFLPRATPQVFCDVLSKPPRPPLLDNSDASQLFYPGEGISDSPTPPYFYLP